MRSQAARRLRLAKAQSIPRPALSSGYSSSSRQLQPRRPPDSSNILKGIDAARTPVPEDATPSEILELFTRRIREVADPHKRELPVAEPEGRQTSQGGSPTEPGSEGDSVSSRRPKTRRIRLLADKEKEPEVELPPRPTLHSDLIPKIRWASPQSSDPSGGGEPSPSSATSHSEASGSGASGSADGVDPKLPPPYILDEVEQKLRVILHPHAQKNGLRKPEEVDWRAQQSVVEPTLALFCPIEGGNHVIDATVQELSQRVDADVTVLDAVQLAAGLNGAYGEASPAAAALSRQQQANPVQTEQEHSKPDEPDWALRSTDEQEGVKLRERGIKSWLKDWDQYGEEAIRDELPWFDPFNFEAASRGSGLAKAFGGASGAVRVMGPIGSMPDLRDQISRMIKAVRGDPPSEEPSEDDDSQYFSVAAVMPTVRQPELETSERLQRRKEINQLSFRTVLRNMGGVVPGQVDDYVLPKRIYSMDTAVADESGEVEGSLSTDPTRLMFSEWERSLVDRETLREVAVRALGQSMATRVAEVPANSEGSTSPGGVDEGNTGLTTVTWGSVALAWRQWFLYERQRKEWIAHQRRRTAPSKEARTTDKDPSDDAAPEVDEVIERVKVDPTLDAHEKRLLGCIVDTTTVPTTFANVHLPVKTVDAIRTMVSLPLLYPKAFTEGILKSHSMTGALLLGPPGVGKTLLARAVAREQVYLRADHSNISLTTSTDVMDMYVGEGEKLVKSVFSLARRLSPCVIFLDEVDALLASRISSRESDAVKESLQLPWLTENKTPDQPSPDENQGARLLHKRHFAKALTEVTPSSSESLGTLHDLRKWNEEFGEGRVKSGGRKAKWGEKFGFGGKDAKDVDGRVMTNDTAP
ncbi:hypothetical protein FRC01_005160 [Tulasnella sp. 417]|nr:hypothetical protein FRC01_005160 [Tulasnella sp. 417]